MPNRKTSHNKVRHTDARTACSPLCGAEQIPDDRNWDARWPPFATWPWASITRDLKPYACQKTPLEVVFLLKLRPCQAQAAGRCSPSPRYVTQLRQSVHVSLQLLLPSPATRRNWKICFFRPLAETREDTSTSLRLMASPVIHPSASSQPYSQASLGPLPTHVVAN